MLSKNFRSLRRIPWVAFLLTNLAIAELPAQQVASMVGWTKPPALKPGDTIAIVAPAGPVELEKVRAYAEQLKAAGFRIQMSASIDRRSGFLAGADQERIDEMNSAIRDPSVRAIFAARGGYGLTRILDKIDYAALQAQPKIICGYSDLTALHLAIARKVKLITFHSPMPMSNLWNQEEPKFKYANESFERVLRSSSYVNGLVGFEIPVPQSHQPSVVVEGKAQGRLLGGNLTLIAATLGTEYAIDPEGAILFIEDIEEAPYRVDRMLSQLRLSGVLDRISGLVIGDFTYKDGSEQPQIEAVFRDYFEKAKYPVLWNFPVGHIPSNATMPHGALVELDTQKKTLRLLENPVNP